MLKQLVLHTAHIDKFLLYLAVATAMVSLSLFIYEKITPYREFQMILAGNTAAAISLSGALLGLTFPVVMVTVISHEMAEFAIWGSIGLGAQLVSYLLVAFALRKVRHLMIEGNVAVGTFLGAAHVATGLLVAAAMAE